MTEKFQNFMEEVRQKVEERLNEEVLIKSSQKNNGVVLYGLEIHTTGSNCFPIFYMEKWFEEYLQGEEVEDIVSAVVNDYLKSKYEREIKIDSLRVFAAIKDKIVYRLVNTELNREMLKDVPYQPVLNLAKIYFVEVSDITGIKSTFCKVSNELLNTWGISQEEMFTVAEENTPKLYPVDIFPMNEILKSLWREDWSDDAQPFVDYLADINGGMAMYVMSNTHKLFGASVICYENTLKKVAEQFESDLIILPSSVHEVILLPKKHYKEGYDTFVEMVKEVNKEQVVLEERLADNIYIYHRETKSLEMVS